MAGYVASFVLVPDGGLMIGLVFLAPGAANSFGYEMPPVGTFSRNG